MKNLILGENEEIRKVLKGVAIKANDNEFVLTIMVTNERIILLKDINRELVFNEFLNARGVSIPENLEVVFEESLDNILDYKYEDGNNIITFTNSNNKLTFYCKPLF